MSKFQIFNRWNGKVQFECDLSPNLDMSSRDVRIGAAIKIALASGCNLSGSDLSGCNLDGCNLSGSSIPKIDGIHQAVFAAASNPSALDMTKWHSSCETAHCRAGWVVALAGDGGRVLEGCWGTPAAAAAIYMASDPTLDLVPDFYVSNEEALADMKRLAEIEASKG